MKQQLLPCLLSLFWAVALVGQADWTHYRDSCWQALEVQLERTDTIEPVLATLADLEVRYREQDELAAFYPPATRFLKTVYEYGHFDPARAYLARLARRARSWPPERQPLRGEALYQIGRSFYFTYEVDSCAHYVRYSLACYADDSPLTTWHHNLLAVMAEDDGQLDSAAFYYARAIHAADRQQDMDPGVLGGFQMNLANVLFSQGRPDTALAAFRAALDLRTTAWGPDDTGVAEVYLNLGTFYIETGQPVVAEDYFRQALRIYRLAEGPSSVGVAYCYQSLGLCSQVNGAYEEALNFSHQAARIYRDQQPPDRRHLAGTYRNRANVLRRLGRFEQALAEHQRVLDLDEELEDIGAQADDYTNLGIVFGETGNWTEALAHHQQALVLWRTLPDHPVDLANAHVNLAESLEQLGQYAMARLQADTAQLILESAMGQRHALLAYTFNVQARLAYQAGRLDQALDWIQRALVANHQHFDGPSLAALPDLVGYYHYEYLLTSLRLKAELLWARYPNDEAYRRLAQAQYDWALQLLEQVRGELTQREDQLTLVRQVKDLAAAAIAHCYDLAELTGETAWLEKAFTYVEKSKANVLLGAMAANEARYFAGIPDSLLARENQLMADIGYYKRQLAAEPDTSRRVALQQSLFTAQEAYKALLDHYETAFPFYYDLLYANEVPGVKALQFVLEPGQVMVDYFLSDSLLYAFVLSKDQFSVATSPMDPRFARELTGFRKGISRGLDRTYLEKAQALYPALFPFEIPRNCRHLILSPDGGLLLIPFEALLTAPVAGTGTDYTRLPFLIRDYAVRYTPSASLFYQSHATQSLTPEVQVAEGLLAVAPVFDEPVAGGAQVHASLAGYVVPLPYTEQEVNEITNLFAREGELARASLHEAASESLLKSGSLATSRFVHIATHGLIDEEEPDLSGLLLYPDSLAGEDGLLSVGEVYNLRLNAELVVLSACETATGKIATGEGVLGFVRAFLYAGADRLVVSLWKVADDATADLMIRFYQQLLEQPDPDHAEVLRAAKLQLIESGAFSHPRFWSAFILTEG